MSTLIIIAIAVVWYGIGVAGSCLALWFGFVQDGLDVRRSDFIGGLFIALVGPVSLCVGLMWAIAFALKRYAPTGNPIIWRGRR